jgi:hypothetical protein
VACIGLPGARLAKSAKTRQLAEGQHFRVLGAYEIVDACFDTVSLLGDFAVSLCWKNIFYVLTSNSWAQSVLGTNRDNMLVDFFVSINNIHQKIKEN